MPRARWADLGPGDDVPQPPTEEDAWGPDEDAVLNEAAQQPVRPITQAQVTALADALQAIQAAPFQHDLHHQSNQQRRLQLAQQHEKPARQQLYRHQVPSLHKLSLTVLATHVTELVQQLGDEVQWLPSDVRAVLLAVARRRGELTAAVLSCLADDSWTQLDLSGCSKLYWAHLLDVAPRIPNLKALDLTGCERISSGGWRQLAQCFPNLEVLRLGGSATCNAAAVKALTHLLPGIPPPRHKLARTTTSTSSPQAAREPQTEAPLAAGVLSEAPEPAAAVAESWEDAFESSESGGDEPCTGFGTTSLDNQTSSHAGNLAGVKPRATATSSSSGSRSSSSQQLKHLRALIWPDAPEAAAELIQLRCPRVLLNPCLKPDKATGELPPREWHPAPLDEPFAQMVTAAAFEVTTPDTERRLSSLQRQRHEPLVHIADKFRQAYIDRAERLKEKERRLQAIAERKQLRASHALRTLDAWLDE